MNMQYIDAFILYFVILLGIGFVAYLKTRRAMAKRSGGDFMLGGRSLSFWVTAFSANASDMSNWLFMGYPAMIFMHGISEVWAAIGLVLFSFLNWHFIAPKIRTESERTNTMTLSGYLSARFADSSGIIRTLVGLLSIFFFIIYISAMLNGIGKIFDVALGFDYSVAILVSIIVIVLYTLVGGFIAVAWIDSFQALFLLAMIVMVPLISFVYIHAWCGSGWHAIMNAAAQKGVSLSLLSSTSPWSSFSYGLLVMLGWGLGYFGMPHIQTKFMGIADPKEMYKSKYVGLVWQIIVFCGAIMVGLIGLAVYTNGLFDTEMIFVNLVKDLFPPFIVGFVLCAILAATISTIDSMVLVVANIVTDDFYRHSVRPAATHTELLLIYRITILVTCVLAALIALCRMSTVYALVWYAWTGLGASFGPVVIMALYSKRVTKWGAIAGIATGGVVAALWQPYVNAAIMHFEVPGMVPSFAASLLAIYFVSLWTNNK